jgi:hypothetical protein
MALLYASFFFIPAAAVAWWLPEPPGEPEIPGPAIGEALGGT